MPDYPFYILEEPVEEFRSLVYGHPNSTRIRWWKATRDPNYDRTKGRSSLTQTLTGGDNWRRDEQPVADFRALVQGAEVVKRYMEAGALLSGDLVITTLPEELPLGDHDWIVVTGAQQGRGDSPQARTYRNSEMLLRGSTALVPPGQSTNYACSIDLSGNVSGVNTDFTAAFRTGDILLAGGRGWRISAVNGTASMNVVANASTTLPLMPFMRGVEKITQHGIAVPERLLYGTTDYIYEKDYILDADEQTIKWLTAACPPCGAQYAFTYGFYPKYEVVPTMGMKRAVINGINKPQRVIARMITEDTYTNQQQSLPSFKNGEV